MVIIIIFFFIIIIIIIMIIIMATITFNKHIYIDRNILHFCHIISITTVIVIIIIIVIITTTIIIIIMIMNYQEGGSSGFCWPAFLWVSWGWLASLLCPLFCLAVLLARISFLALNCAGTSLAVLFCP